MPPPDSRLPLSILHTNDFHDRLTPERAERIRELFRQTAEPRLLVDAGDAGASGNIMFLPAGEPILQAMSELGYSAMTVGNRDFHVSRVGFRAKLARAAFPILCANVRPSRLAAESDTDLARPLGASACEGEPDLRTYILCEEPGWRVLVVGFTVPMVTSRMWERKLSAYIFDPPVARAAQVVPELKRLLQPDLTVALTHIGIRQDRELAASVPEIDLIIGGHSHETLPNGERVGDVMIVQAGSHGRFVGVVQAEKATGEPRARISARIEPL